jgi:hypothetical protein
MMYLGRYDSFKFRKLDEFENVEAKPVKII